MDRKSHWEAIYAQKEPSQLTWFQAQPQQSLQMIAATGVPDNGRIIDVGGGTSLLVDFLCEAGYLDITILDIAGPALARCQERLGQKANDLTWIEADVTAAALPADYYDIWHDRAVFHFLTNSQEVRHYVAAVQRALRPGGHIILATFALDGPEKCSGLDVVRYGDRKIDGVFASGFELLSSVPEQHVTPWDTTQNFTYFHLRRLAPEVRLFQKA